MITLTSARDFRALESHLNTIASSKRHVYIIFSYLRRMNLEHIYGTLRLYFFLTWNFHIQYTRIFCTIFHRWEHSNERKEREAVSDRKQYIKINSTTHTDLSKVKPLVFGCVSWFSVHPFESDPFWLFHPSSLMTRPREGVTIFLSQRIYLEGEEFSLKRSSDGDLKISKSLMELGEETRNHFYAPRKSNVRHLINIQASI